MPPPLTIKINTDASSSILANKAIQAEMARTVGLAEQMAFKREQVETRAADASVRAEARASSERSRLVTTALSQEEVVHAARNRVMDRFNQNRIQAAEKAMSAEKQGFLESIGAADLFQNAIQNVVVQFASMQAAAGAVRAIVGVFSDAKAASEAMARQVLDTLGSLREIAAIKGKYAPDDEELARFVKLRQETGLSHEQALAFTGQLQNTLGTVTEEKFPQAEREKLAVLGGQLAARVSTDAAGAETRATYLGLLPKFMPGKPTAEQVVGYGSDIEAILGRGAARNPQMASEFTKVMTTMAGQEGAGLFRDARSAAGFTAIASQFEKEGFGTAAVEFGRELRGVTRFRKVKGAQGSQAQWLKEAGITEFDDPEAAAMKMFQKIDVETKGGTTESVDQYLKRRGFGQETGVTRIKQFFESYKQGGFEDIMGMADRPVDMARPAKQFEEFRQTAIGRDVINKANEDAAKVERGIQGRETMLRAGAEMPGVIREGAIDSPLSFLGTRMALSLAGHVAGSQMELPQYLAEQRAAAKAGRFNLEAAGQGVDVAGVGGVPSFVMHSLLTATGLYRSLSGGNAQAINSAYGAQTPEGFHEMKENLDRNARATDQNTRALQGKGATPPPIPIVRRPAGPERS